MRGSKVYAPAFRSPADPFRWKVWYAYTKLALNSPWTNSREEYRVLRVALARQFRAGLPALMERLRDLDK